MVATNGHYPLILKLVFHFPSVKEPCKQDFHPMHWENRASDRAVGDENRSKRRFL